MGSWHPQALLSWLLLDSSAGVEQVHEEKTRQSVRTGHIARIGKFSSLEGSVRHELLRSVGTAFAGLAVLPARLERVLSNRGSALAKVGGSLRSPDALLQQKGPRE